MATLNEIFGISDALSEDAVKRIVPLADELAIKHHVPKPTAEMALMVALAFSMRWEGGDPAGALRKIGEHLGDHVRAKTKR
jgi:hypothetical protein